MHYTIIKFLYIAICLSVAILSYNFCNSKKDCTFLVVALGFTLVADYFLVLRHNYVAGVFVFCFVQVAYILRVSDIENGIKKNALKIASVIAVGTLFYLFFPNSLIILAAVYAALFAINLKAHISLLKEGHSPNIPQVNRRIMLAGIVLFALCDIHVLIFNLNNYIPIPRAITLWGQAGIWVFYVPSQFLLSVSAARWAKSLSSIN